VLANSIAFHLPIFNFTFKKSSKPYFLRSPVKQTSSSEKSDEFTTAVQLPVHRKAFVHPNVLFEYSLNYAVEMWNDRIGESHEHRGAKTESVNNTLQNSLYRPELNDEVRWLASHSKIPSQTASVSRSHQTR